MLTPFSTLRYHDIVMIYRFVIRTIIRSFNSLVAMEGGPYVGTETHRNASGRCYDVVNAVRAANSNRSTDGRKAGFRAGLETAGRAGERRLDDRHAHQPARFEAYPPQWGHARSQFEHGRRQVVAGDVRFQKLGDRRPDLASEKPRDRLGRHGQQNDTDWTHFEKEIKLPECTASFNVLLLVEGDGKAWLDDVHEASSPVK